MSVDLNPVAGEVWTNPETGNGSVSSGWRPLSTKEAHDLAQDMVDAPDTHDEWQEANQPGGGG